MMKGDIVKIGIIGGGASGLVAAIEAKNNNNDVTIYEKNVNCGKKILVTGNGKCNYFNEHFNIEHYHSENVNILKTIITDENKQKVLSFFHSIGIVPKVLNGHYYPASGQAITIEQALLIEAKCRGVNIINNVEIKTIEYTDKFILTTDSSKYYADKIVLATGSKAAPKTGSDGLGYELAKSFNHHIIKPLPALVQLCGKYNFFKDWAGVRADVNVSYIEDDILVKEVVGEIQLTNYGVSGICIFQLSGQIVRSIDAGKKATLAINFVPWLKGDCLTYLEERNDLLYNRNLSQLLDGFLNYKLVNLILKKNKINGDISFNDLSYAQKCRIASDLENFIFEVTGYNDFDASQVCSGGIPLDEIDINTMESKFRKDLYIIGELLDVDGECGGYNLGFAWLSGMLAGNSIKENL